MKRGLLWTGLAAMAAMTVAAVVLLHPWRPNELPSRELIDEIEANLELPQSPPGARAIGEYVRYYTYTRYLAGSVGLPNNLLVWGYYFPPDMMPEYGGAGIHIVPFDEMPDPNRIIDGGCEFVEIYYNVETQLTQVGCNFVSG